MQMMQRETELQMSTMKYAQHNSASSLKSSNRRRFTQHFRGFGQLSLFLRGKRKGNATKRISLGKFGMKKMDHKDLKMRKCNNIHPYPENHMAAQATLFPIVAYGDAKLVTEWFGNLTPAIKEKVRKSGFEELILSLEGAPVDGPLIQALGAKWWDTTHTFHFRTIGEITMTPKDFSAITGLPVCGMPLFINHGLHRKKRLLYRLLGHQAVTWARRRVPISWLYKTYSDFHCVCTADEDVVARAFILALLGATIFSSPKMDVDLNLLTVMYEISRIQQYNWGAAALGILYNEMDDISRRNKSTIGGLWHSWEVWAREYFKIFPLIQPVRYDRVFPASKRWNLAQKPDDDENIRLEYYQIKLDNICYNNVEWNPWGLDSELPWYVSMSIDATRRRILLLGPTGGTWYLAERVTMQSLGRSERLIPNDPPKSMMRPWQLSVTLNPVALIGESAHSLVAPLESYKEDFGSRQCIPEQQHTCSTEVDINHKLDAHPAANTTAFRVAIPSGITRCNELPFESQMFNVPPEIRQVPVRTAVKLLETVGGLQLLLVDTLQNAEEKLRDTAATLATVREELGLQLTTDADIHGSKTCEESNNPTY